MKIGIFTYGTRGDVQPYIALALGLKENGHEVMLAAPENFQDFVEGFGVKFYPLHGNAEEGMNSAEGKSILKTENTIKLMKYFFKVLHSIRVPLRDSYFKAISQIDFIIANPATITIVSTIAEKLNKKIAFTYFMPPLVPTKEFPLGDFDFFDFPLYNKFTYKLAYYFFWRFVKDETNEYRKELGMPILKENLLTYIDRQKPLDLLCLSPSLIPQPKDWDSNHKITGFLTIPAAKRENHIEEQVPDGLSEWLATGEKPVYIGFGSNGVGNTEKMIAIVTKTLNETNERLLFCTGWTVYENMPIHKNLFVTKYLNHEAFFPKCKVGIFHGGVGTLAAMLRNNLPVIIVSFYTDQPTWGKIAVRMGFGIHIPIKKLTADKLMDAINESQTEEIRQNIFAIGEKIRNENGLENAVREIEMYFEGKGS